MPKFVPQRQEQILPQMVSKMVARTDLSDITDSASMKHLLAAAARSDAQLYYQIVLLLQLFSIDKAARDDLDERAKDIQPTTLSRILAKKSTGNVVFSASTAVAGTVNIAIGTKIKTSSGVLYTTTAAGSITPASPELISGHGVGRDSGLVPVIADVGGTNGNVIAGAINKFEVKPAGVAEVTNLTALTNGLDKESDDSFRARLKDFINSLARCHIGGIEFGVIGEEDPISGSTVLYARIVEDTVERGEMILYIDDGTGAFESTAVIAAENVTLGIGSVPYQQAIVTVQASDLIDGETVQIDDGVNAPTTFEFDIGGGGVTPGNVAVVLTGTETDEQVADALETAINAVGATLDATVITKVSNVLTVELDSAPLGTLVITDTVADTSFITGTISSAVGGETRLFLDEVPVKETEPFTLTSSVRGVLVLDTDYTLNDATGQIEFTPALVAGEVITAAYTHYTGLIQYIQKVVDGDPDDRTNYPGLRAGGTRVRVRLPQVLTQNINASITVKEGFDQEQLQTSVQQAIVDYINGLTISGDVIRAEMIKRAMNITGVSNIVISLPAADRIILDDQLARTTPANVSVG